MSSTTPNNDGLDLWNRVNTGQNEEEDDDSDCEIIDVKPSANHAGASSSFSLVAGPMSEGKLSIESNPEIDSDLDDDLHKQLEEIVNNDNSAKEKNPHKDWRCKCCTYLNKGYNESCVMCEAGFRSEDVSSLGGDKDLWGEEDETKAQKQSSDTQSSMSSLDKMVEIIESLDCKFGSGNDFWNQQWRRLVACFVDILQDKKSNHLIEPVDEERLESIGKPRYRSIIKNPLSFLCILNAMTKKNGNGLLENTSLSFNVRTGKDLIQAIDLVFLNSLAFNGKERTQVRNNTLKLRKKFWENILRLSCCAQNPVLPTKRGETSGFVVHKNYR
uniref:RanBP2-type domain-containing protein n=1 Tax=Proboscia inermis TaxID=420281 RepID=A0A7S0CIB2_9STRA